VDLFVGQKALLLPTCSWQRHAAGRVARDPLITNREVEHLGDDDVTLPHP
jgi:hypothetical protein